MGSNRWGQRTAIDGVSNRWGQRTIKSNIRENCSLTQIFVVRTDRNAAHYEGRFKNINFIRYRTLGRCTAMLLRVPYVNVINIKQCTE
jgi:hypothetical protein